MNRLMPARTFITFIADVWPGEPDILGPVKDLPLSIRTPSGALRQVSAPAGGWTQAQLESYANTEQDDIADAYVGGVWVGGSEV